MGILETSRGDKMNDLLLILGLAGWLLLIIGLFVDIPKISSYTMILWAAPTGAAVGAALKHQLF